MEKSRREGIAHLEDILTRAEEIISLFKVPSGAQEKSIHREIKEAFLIRTKTEALIRSLSQLHATISQIEEHQKEILLWAHSNYPSPLFLQRESDKKSLLNELHAAYHNTYP
ncbi:hypothetical protein NEFER03_1596 [Nematocida sp. LUAm3]|nr:hypothetical protein NEFER03_1596 [Nematocida sp. LUAm3]KAI5176373.1 hypothetical protein NEFER02_2147 [Nematocida sp. LUAm2]KAI5179033.1 hypothetical protein NEFER01_1909 [Nematocida sp. LUAm1]